MSIYDNLDRAAAHAYDAGVLAERERIRQLALSEAAKARAYNFSVAGPIGASTLEDFADLLTDPEGDTK